MLYNFLFVRSSITRDLRQKPMTYQALPGTSMPVIWCRDTELPFGDSFLAIAGVSSTSA